tara:strand:+ start:1736 stop:2677 length:942 start_codon:yes stop_codon:yes gene_type:complete
MNNTFIPWVEKYRPQNFNDIVLDSYNKILLKNIIENEYFPNLLFYGPPGTGKTTTIINLIDEYTKLYSSHKNSKELLIHLNASDERGIDTIRNQILTFVSSKNLFNKGIKFVILDEVDYMTKNAQLALKHLLSSYDNVRFCLICNYISRIDESLQNEFLRIRFNKLPESNIISFLQKINKNENLNLSSDKLQNIQYIFKSDIRSMINYIQTNQETIKKSTILNKSKFEELDKLIKKKNIKKIVTHIEKLSIETNSNINQIIKKYVNYIINIYNVTTSFLNFIENLMHNQNIPEKEYIYYFLYNMITYNFEKKD